VSRKPLARLAPRLRIVHKETVVLGPGKADLLEAIARHGTVRDAASELGMSYMRAWKLVQTMNNGFREPVVILHRGGSERGGAELTPTGREVLRLYRAMEAESLRATKKAWEALLKLLA
jgi:molybdate transport system regulatory protein